MCYLCDRLHKDQDSTKVIPDFEKWWHGQVDDLEKPACEDPDKLPWVNNRTSEWKGWTWESYVLYHGMNYVYLSLTSF